MGFLVYGGCCFMASSSGKSSSGPVATRTLSNLPERSIESLVVFESDVGWWLSLYAALNAKTMLSNSTKQTGPASSLEIARSWYPDSGEKMALRSSSSISNVPVSSMVLWS
jgi:hypothetical protein